MLIWSFFVGDSCLEGMVCRQRGMESRKIFAGEFFHMQISTLSLSLRFLPGFRFVSISFTAILLALVVVAGPRASAQNNEAVRNMAAPGTKLDASAQAVIARLGTLKELPDGQWKMHAGDLAHGEALKLNESDWTAVAPATMETPVGKLSNDALWFRQRVVVPKTLNGYDLTGARIWFQFRAWVNGQIPEILYFNGRRVAMGDDLEPTILLDSAKPGDEVVVAIKLLHTEDQKTFAGGFFRIEFPSERPSPEALREEFQSAALLVPSLSGNDLKQMGILNSAIDKVDLKSLDAGDQKIFDASLIAARGELEALRPLLQTATLHLTGNSHIDAAWLWPWTETVDVVKRTFGTALQLMYEYPDYTYTQSAAQYNEWLAQKYPDINKEIAQRIKEGRWEIVGGMWVEPDLNMPDGESLVRQLLVGKRWYKNAYGVDVRIGWNPDSFGYTWQLPQIYKKSGVDYFVTQKMTWNDTNQLPFKLFWWESPDGSKVLAYFPHDYANGDLSPVRLSGDLKTARERAPGMTEMMDLYGVGDHGGGPTRAILDEGFGWAKGTQTDPKPVLPKMQFGIAQSFFSDVEKQIAPDSPEWNYSSIAKGYKAPDAVAGKVAIPTWKSELYFEYHRGVMTTQANHKKNMRESEVEVLDAEKWASLAWLDGKKYPADELTEDWKKVLFNQFHDLAAGSGIGVIYKDAQKDYDVVKWSTNEISAKSLETVTERINTQEVGKDPDGQSIVIFNPLGWERSGDVLVHLKNYTNGFDVRDPTSYNLRDKQVTDELDRRFFAVQPMNPNDTEPGAEDKVYRIHVSDVPAFGYRVLEIVPDATRNYYGHLTAHRQIEEETNSSFVLSNSYFSVAIDKATGCIISLIDKETHFEAIKANTCANELQAFKDTPKDYDAWNIDPGTLDAAPTVLNQAEKVELINEKTTHAAVRITRSWQKSKFVQTISVNDYSDAVNIDNEVDWHEDHVLLKAAFPLVVESDHATYEIPYGSIERTTKRGNSWEKAQFEVAAMRWADLSGKGADGKVHGLSVINDSKYGYDAAGNVLRLTLLRSPTWPDAEADRGHHHFHYALYPHSGDWKDAETVRRGWEYNYPLTAVVTTAHGGELPAEYSFASVEPRNVVLTAVKKAEDADGLVLRAYEWAGKDSVAEFHVPKGATGATVTNLMETPEGEALKIEGDVVKVPIHPYEILTIEVTYPKARD
jgi:alpha-mannosidase